MMGGFYDAMRKYFATKHAQRDLELREDIYSRVIFKDRPPSGKQQNSWDRVKPHIYMSKTGKYWICHCAGTQSYGWTPKAAFDAWGWKRRADCR